MPRSRRLYQEKKSRLPLPDPNQSYLTIAETAALLRVSIQTIRNYIHNGELKAISFAAGYRLNRHTIDQFMSARERVIPPYRSGTRDWVRDRHEANRQRAALQR